MALRSARCSLAAAASALVHHPNGLGGSNVSQTRKTRSLTQFRHTAVSKNAAFLRSERRLAPSKDTKAAEEGAHRRLQRLKRFQPLVFVLESDRLFGSDLAGEELCFCAAECIL